MKRRCRGHSSLGCVPINGWIGEHGKWAAAAWAVGAGFIPAEWSHVGDSTTDALMLERMPLSVGVANIARFVPKLGALPS